MFAIKKKKKKLWDVRRLQTPYCCFDDVPILQDTAEVAFAPDSTLLLAGTHVKKGEGTGHLCIYHSGKGELLQKTPISEGSSVISMVWHDRINQIIVGASDGKAHVLYDPLLSTKGALLTSTRKRRSVVLDDLDTPVYVYTPNALPMYQDEPR